MSAFSSLGQYLFGVPQVSSAPYTQEAQQLQQQAQKYAGREQSDYNNEAGLADSLYGTVNGTGGPSVADTQLQQSFGQNLNNGLAMGAGASGANSVLARYLAAQQTGNSGAQLAQAAGIQRAKESQAAQQQLGGLYGNMDSQSSGLYGTNLSTGLGYNTLANNVDQANAGRQQNATNAALGAAAGLATGGASYFSGMGGGSGGLGSSDPATSNAAWAAYGA